MKIKSAYTRSYISSSKFFIALALAAFAMTPAKAAVTFGASGLGNDTGETNSATATFNLFVSGTTTDLVITLTNTAKYDPNDAPDILTGVFFTLAGDPTLTKMSAVLNTGSTGVEDGTNLTILGGVVGGSWAYAAGLSGAPHGANEGISGAGLGLFGPGNLFPGAMLPGDKNPPSGVGGGLTTAIDDGSKYNGGVSGRPLIQDSVVFTLDGVPANFLLSDISNVSFQYGTDTTEPNYVGVLIPEPSTAALTMAGIALLGLLNRKRR